MAMVICGDFEPEKILEEIKKRLIDTKANGEIKRIYPEEPESIVKEHVIQNMEVSRPLYAIGIKEPLSIYVNTFGTGIKTDEEIVELIKQKFDLTPDGIINYLNLKEPIYEETTNYGHFGKENLPWEKIIKL